MVAELLASAIGDSTVDNTAAETSIFSTTIPAGTPGTDELLITRYIADVRNDSGAAATVIERCKYGGTTFHAMTTISLADAGATNRYADLGMWFLGGENSVTAQRSMFEHKQGGSAPLGGSSGGNDHNVTINNGTVDSASSQTLELTAQLSAANTELEFRRRGVWVERWNTDDPADGAAGTRLVNLDLSEVTWSNSTAENSVYSCTIPGGTLGTGNLLIARVCMDVLNTAITNQYWIEVYYGGTNIVTSSAGVNNTASASRRAAPIEVWLGGHGATNDQVVGMLGRPAVSNALSGEGLSTTPSGYQALQHVGACAVDSTTDQTFEITVSMQNADAGSSVRKTVGMCSVIKA